MGNAVVGKVSISRIDWAVVIIMAAFSLQVLFFVPLEMFLNNITEFSVQFFQLLFSHLVMSVAVIIVLCLMAKTIRTNMFLAGITCVSLVVFIESRIFFTLAGHGPFDGKVIAWEKLRTVSAIELTTVAAVVIVIGLLWQRRELFVSLSVFILLFHTGLLLYLGVSNIEMIRESEQYGRRASEYFSDFYRLSRERNVIHIVLDQAQSGMVYDIVRSDPSRYSDVFAGFTLFTGCSGRYMSTYPSVPFYMTGRAPRPNRDVVVGLSFTWDYVETLLEKYSVVNTLARNEFKTFGFQFSSALYCKGMYTGCTGTIQDVFGGGRITNMNGPPMDSILTLLDLTLFQITPIALRRYIYNDGKWFLGRLGRRTYTPSGILDRFINNLTVDGRRGSYNYFHHLGGHAPIQFGENCEYIGPQEITYDSEQAQVTCALLQIERLLKKLKHLGIYDRTLIIVHGDTGTPGVSRLIPSENGKLVSASIMGTANPLMLVKRLGGFGPLRFSAAPVTIGDVPSTISNAFGLRGQFPGIPMFDLTESSKRERDYLSYDDSSKVSGLQALPNVKRYRIRGNLFNEYDWILPDLSDVGGAPTALPMDYKDFVAFARGFSTLSDGDKRPVRWVDGKVARVYLSFPTIGRTQLVFDSYVPPAIRGQSIKVSINGNFIVKLDDEELRAKLRHIVEIADDVPRKKVNTIEFTFGKAVKLGNDKRHLSVLFAYIGLEPVRN